MRLPIYSLLSVVLGVVLGVAGVSSAGAAANDAFSAPLELGEGTEAVGVMALMGAGFEEGEWGAWSGDGEGTVWARWVAPANVFVRVSAVVPPDHEPWVSVFKTDELRGANSDSLRGGGYGGMGFLAEAGAEYRFQIKGESSETRDVSLELRSEGLEETKARDGALVLEGALPVGWEVEVGQQEEPLGRADESCVCAAWEAERAGWYAVRPADDGRASALRVAVYSAGAEVGAGLGSALFRAEAGEVFEVWVSGYTPQGGEALVLEEVEGLRGNLSRRAAEVVVPDEAGVMALRGRSLGGEWSGDWRFWWTWVAESTQPLRVDFGAESVGAVLVEYETAVGEVREPRELDRLWSESERQVREAAMVERDRDGMVIWPEPGRVFRIGLAVDGPRREFAVRLVRAGDVENGVEAGATDLGSAEMAEGSASVWGAGMEAFEWESELLADGLNYYDGVSTWWTWTAPRDGWFVFSAGLEVDYASCSIPRGAGVTRVDVFGVGAGGVLGHQAGESGEWARFEATAGTTYRLRSGMKVTMLGRGQLARVDDPGSVVGSVRVAAAAADPGLALLDYDGWMEGRGTSGDDERVRDSDGDGVTDWVEFATGGRRLELRQGAGGWTVRVPVNEVAAGVEVGLEVSPDGREWQRLDLAGEQFATWSGDGYYGVELWRWGFGEGGTLLVRAVVEER